MKENYILTRDGFYHELTKNKGVGSVCAIYDDDEAYTVHPDRYIISLDGYLYRIARVDDQNIIRIMDEDKKYQNVVDEPMEFCRRRIQVYDLDDYKCEKPAPLPKIKVNGEGSYECNPDTAICYIDVPKGMKVSIGAKRGYKIAHNGDIAYSILEDRIE